MGLFGIAAEPAPEQIAIPENLSQQHRRRFPELDEREMLEILRDISFYICARGEG
jgi:hypothetical protein